VLLDSLDLKESKKKSGTPKLALPWPRLIAFSLVDLIVVFWKGFS